MFALLHTVPTRRQRISNVLRCRSSALFANQVRGQHRKNSRGPSSSSSGSFLQTSKILFVDPPSVPPASQPASQQRPSQITARECPKSAPGWHSLGRATTCALLGRVLQLCTQTFDFAFFDGLVSVVWSAWVSNPQQAPVRRRRRRH